MAAYIAMQKSRKKWISDLNIDNLTFIVRV